MKNLLKHEIYKLKNSKGIRILFIVVAALTVFSLIIIASMVSLVSGLGNGNISEFISLDSASDFLLYVGIISVILVSTELSRGTLKLTVMSDVSRFEVFVCKYISVAIATTLLFVMQKALMVLGIRLILSSHGLELPGIDTTLFSAIFELLLALSLAAFCNFLSFWLKNTVGVVAVLFGYSIFLSILLVWATISSSPVVQFLNDISYTQVTLNLSISSPTTNWVYYFIALFIYFVPFFIGGYYIFERQEVK